MSEEQNGGMPPLPGPDSLPVPSEGGQPPVVQDDPPSPPAVIEDEQSLLDAAKKRPIEVVCVRKGWFQNERKRVGQEFIVPNFDALGSWMRCKDEAMEKEHRRHVKEEQKRRLKEAQAKA